MTEEPDNTLEEFRFYQAFEKWEDFEYNVIKNISTYISSFIEKNIDKSIQFIDTTLFRGHGDSTWELESTLTRTSEFITILDYYDTIRESSKVINTCFELNWDIPPLKKLKKPDNDELDKLYEKLWENPKKRPYWLHEKVIEFMTYLRHNNFPSPLLDWTRSPYIAAFYAFNSNKDSNGNVAIITHTKFYSEPKHDNVTKHDSKKDADIITLGPYFKSHKRHYLQQSEYTLCTKTDEQETNFAYYKDITVQENPKDDLFIKFILPAYEKDEVIKTLDNKMNINAYSLFGTQEALMNTLSNRNFLFT